MSWGVNSPNKNGPFPLWLAIHMMTLKSPHNLYALPSPINMATMIGQHTQFPPTARSPRQTWSPGYSLRFTESQDPAKHLVGLEQRSLWFWIFWKMHLWNFSSRLYDLIISPHVKHPPINLAKNVCSPMQGFFKNKAPPFFREGGRRLCDLSSYLSHF